MSELLRVIGVGDLPPGKRHVAEVNGREIAIYNVDGAFFAVDNTCAHRGGPLGEGELEGEVVTCPWHSWEYGFLDHDSLCLSEDLRSKGRRH